MIPAEKSPRPFSARNDETPTGVMARLLCDLMLGKLAVYLRMCGHDTIYAGDRDIEDDDALAQLARSTDRRLLSRDRDLVAATPGAIFIESHAVEDQFEEVRSAGIELALPDRPRRCGRCNGTLTDEPVEEPLPDYAPDDGTNCYRCTVCGQLFWKGSHWDRVAQRL